MKQMMASIVGNTGKHSVILCSNSAEYFSEELRLWL